MWENNRLVLGFCVACGVVASYSLSIYLLIIVILLCIYLFVFHFKLLGYVGSGTIKNIFTVPSWMKNIITSLMNSYHLSKPLEPEQPNSRRDSPYSTNIHLPRRGNSRSGHFTCLDENVDYVNRRNGIGLVSSSPTFKNSFSSNLREIRRRGSYNDSENSLKGEELSTPPISPWARKGNYGSGEYTNVRRVQTVAGPLLGSPGMNKRKSTDFGLFVDASSPGLVSRVVQYRDEGASSSSAVWTHQPQYGSPGQFPMVHLNHSSSSLPVLSPLNSQKASRRSVKVKIAPPDPLGSRLFPLSNKNNSSATFIQADHSTKSVIETLKEISRKRIHSQLEDSDDDAAKRQKRNGPLDIPTSNVITDGDNFSKRSREDSPRQQETSPPSQPAKRIRNNEILSSLSSSRKLLQSGGVKRKTQSLDWSRCSTPVLGKQLKTTGNDMEIQTQADVNSKISLAAKKLVATSNTSGDNVEKSNLKTSRTSKEKEKGRLSSPLVNSPVSEKSREISNGPVIASKTPQKGLNAPVENTPRQKDSPFVSVTSPDDIIDDISALEEKREQDRRSRLMSMMAVISGGETHLKALETSETKITSKPEATIVQPTNTYGTDIGSSTSSVAVNFASNVLEKTPVCGSPSMSSWGVQTSVDGNSSEKSPVTAGQESVTSNSAAIVFSSASADVAFPKITMSSPMFSFGVSSSSVEGDTPQNVVTSVLTSVVTTTTNSNQSVVSSTFESPALLVSSLQMPAQFGSVSPMFGSKPVTSDQNTPAGNQIPVTVNGTTSSETKGSMMFSFGAQPNSQITFGVKAVSPTIPAQMAVSSATTTTTSSIAVPTVSPATSSTPSTLLQNPPFGGGVSKEIAAPCFSLPASNITSLPSTGQNNPFSKPVTDSSVKPIPSTQSNAFGVPSPAFGITPTLSSPSGNIANVTPAPFTFGSPASTVSSTGSDVQPGYFAFGSGTSNQNPQAKPMFSTQIKSFGESATTTVSTAVPSVVSNSTIGNVPKAGGFKFDLVDKKPLFSGTSSTAVPVSSTNVFGTSTATTSSEPKPFTFGSMKPLENPFASNSASNISVTTAPQTQETSNPFSSPAVKHTDNNQVKDSVIAFGGSNPTPTGFATPQTGFPVQPTATTLSTTSGGFSFSNAPSTGFSSQPVSVAGGPSLLSTSLPSSTNTFATSTTTIAPAFSFGSSSAFPQSQSSPFSFGTAAKAQPETQTGNLFSFGAAASTPTPQSGPSVFGQPLAAAAPAQTQPVQAPTQAQTPAFQFGSSSSTPGAFTFGASTSANPSANSFSASGSFQLNSAGFGNAAPAMFSIGSGSTAPRIRGGRNRRAK